MSPRVRYLDDDRMRSSGISKTKVVVVFGLQIVESVTTDSTVLRSKRQNKTRVILDINIRLASHIDEV